MEKIIISLLFVLIGAAFIILMAEIKLAKRDIVEAINNSMDDYQRTVPAALYDPGKKRCVLVYPDLIMYTKTKGIK